MTIQALIEQGYRAMYTHHNEQPVSLYAIIDQTGLYVYDMNDQAPSPATIEGYYSPDAAQALAVEHGFAPDWTPAGPPEGGQA
jgi:hypothetical protein